MVTHTFSLGHQELFEPRQHLVVTYHFALQIQLPRQAIRVPAAASQPNSYEDVTCKNRNYCLSLQFIDKNIF